MEQKKNVYEVRVNDRIHLIVAPSKKSISRFFVNPGAQSIIIRPDIRPEPFMFALK